MTRARVGTTLVVLGLLGIVWGVIHVLEVANGPGTGPTTFAARRSYDQVKTSVHASFAGGLLRAFGGGALILVGTRLRRSAGAGVSEPA